jgi:hypothetical protein
MVTHLEILEILKRYYGRSGKRRMTIEQIAQLMHHLEYSEIASIIETSDHPNTEKCGEHDNPVAN